MKPIRRIREIHVTTVCIAGDSKKELKNRIEHYKNLGFKLVSFDKYENQMFKYEVILEKETDFLVNGKPTILKRVSRDLNYVQKDYPCFSYTIKSVDTDNKVIEIEINNSKCGDDVDERVKTLIKDDEKIYYPYKIVITKTLDYEN